MKILGLETHQRLIGDKWTTSGVDYARLVLPLRELAKQPGFEVEIRKDPFTKKERNWSDLTKNWDVIYTSYIDTPEGYVQMAFNAKQNGCHLVMDLDDNVWELTQDNPVYSAYHPGSEKLDILSKILEDVEYVTTTNEYLKKKILKMTNRNYERTKVFPNFINLEEYDYTKAPPKKSDKITILHAGSSTHFKDLTEKGFVSGLQRILKEYPNTEFVTIGNWIPQWQTIAGKQYRQLQGKPDVFEFIHDLWPEMISQTDIVVVPLAYDEATKCKSSIKFLEFSAGKVAGVYSRIRQYEEVVPGNGYLAQTEDEWYQSIKKLMDKKHRQELGDKSYKYIQDWTIQNNIQPLVEFLQSIDG